ncbi:hypothetical protein LIER_30833 [Lithospermum erythrorhizon]|uniref:MULE transposase domain-containing protein n=1 Tax=Lithospermum erythrorhizon TaxID=34254 RepID=A0AAV3RS85_LITER
MTNYVNVVKRKEMAPGDASVMHKWFRDQARIKPGFFYDIQVDDNNEITSIFWADSVMIADYACFGDFVSFDTTYRTNKQYRPLSIFVGFNYHKGTCVFGGALLYEETTIAFKWLFEAFMRCMNYKLPQTLMTDQAPAIADVVREVLPGVYHALCSWHIDQNARKELGARATFFFF